MEIGSIYEIAPETLAGRSENMPEDNRCSGLAEIRKYRRKNCVYTASGREAIALALRSLENSGRDLDKICLLPAYMCDSVFLPFARAGYEIRFYHVDRRLEIDIAAFEEELERMETGVILTHPYYGSDTCRKLRDLYESIRKRDICIIEDVTQSYYLEEGGRGADYVVGSLRKWYPIPDGGFVASDEELVQDGLSDGEEYAARRLKPLTDKWDYLFGGKLAWEAKAREAAKADFLRCNRELEKQLDEYAGIRRMSGIAAHILGGIDEAAAKRQRRENAAYLSAHLREAGVLDPAYFSDDGPAPLYFAVYAERRDEMQELLAKHGIYAPVLWPVGAENAAYLTEDEKYIYAHMLALPVDQRYGTTQMRYIADTFRQSGAALNARDKDVIGIRADANEEVGAGHIMRCITIAKQLKKRGRRVCFFTADDYASGFLEQAEMEYVCLHTAWDHMEEETQVLREALAKTGCGKLLVDSYCAGPGYFEGLRDLCKLICIDDCFAALYPVDMLINYNAYHTRFDYERAYGGGTKLLLGTAYVPLREAFGERRAGGGYPDAKAGGNRHVLLSSGGGDVYHALVRILQAAVEEPGMERVVFDTVVGRFHPNAAELERLAERHANIRLHRDVKDMAGLMRGCEAAVSAAGTMLFELSATGIPTVFFISADNQRYDSEFFGEEERMLCAGDIRTDADRCVANILSGLEKILTDEELGRRMRAALMQVTDGRGAERIAEEIDRL